MSAVNDGPGYVYILINPGMPGLVKIGQTQGDPKDRAKEVSRGTGVPHAFAVVHFEHVPDRVATERRVHRRLAGLRGNRRREFFEMPTADAIDIVREIAD